MSYIFLIINIGLMIWVYQDAQSYKERGGLRDSDLQPVAWLMLTFCFGFIAFLIYWLVIRHIYEANIELLQSSTPPFKVGQNTRFDCPRCGESVARSARVCRFCGVQLKSEGDGWTDGWSAGACGVCNKPMSPHAKICPHCNARRPDAPAVAGEADWDGAPASYTRRERHPIIQDDGSDEIEIEDGDWDEGDDKPQKPAS